MSIVPCNLRRLAMVGVALALCLGSSAAGAQSTSGYQPPPAERTSGPREATVVYFGGDHEEPDSTPRFGRAGQFVLTTGTSVGIASTAWDHSSASSLLLTIAPAFEYFVMDDFSIGAELDVDWNDNEGYGVDGSLVETRTSLLGAGPHFGVNIRLGRRFSLYPQLDFGIHRSAQTETLISGRTLSITVSPTGSTSITKTGPWFSVDAPILFHAAPHFFLGFGPVLYYDFSRAQGGPDVGAERTNLGAHFVAGGYWGGPDEGGARPPRAASPALESRRFGDRGTLAITQESVLSWRTTWFSGTDSGSTSITLTPGADWFVDERFSLGGALTYANSSTTGLDPLGTRIDFARRTIGFEARVGDDVRLTPSFSLFPRLASGIAEQTTTASSTGGPSSPIAYEHSDEIIYVSLFVPFLFHVDTHFFVGAGPSAYHELVHTIEHSPQQNRGTTLGVGSLLGGWL